MRKALTFFGWPILLVPMLFGLLGMGMNYACVARNGHVMPVSNPICQTDERDMVAHDHLHVCETSSTKLKVLDDRWPATGMGVLSAGDIVQEESESLQTPAMLIWLLVVLRGLFLRIRPDTRSWN